MFTIAYEVTQYLNMIVAAANMNHSIWYNELHMMHTHRTTFAFPHRVANDETWSIVHKAPIQRDTCVEEINTKVQHKNEYVQLFNE